MWPSKWIYHWIICVDDLQSLHTATWTSNDNDFPVAFFFLAGSNSSRHWHRIRQGNVSTHRSKQSIGQKDIWGGQEWAALHTQAWMQTRSNCLPGKEHFFHGLARFLLQPCSLLQASDWPSVACSGWLGCVRREGGRKMKCCWTRERIRVEKHPSAVAELKEREAREGTARILSVSIPYSTAEPTSTTP